MDKHYAQDSLETVPGWNYCLSTRSGAVNLDAVLDAKHWNGCCTGRLEAGMQFTTGPLCSQLHYWIQYAYFFKAVKGSQTIKSFDLGNWCKMDEPFAGRASSYLFLGLVTRDALPCPYGSRKATKLDLRRQLSCVDQRKCHRTECLSASNPSTSGSFTATGCLDNQIRPNSRSNSLTLLAWIAEHAD